MIRRISILICVSFLVAVSAAAKGPLAVVSSVSSSSEGPIQGPIHLYLITQPKLVSEDEVSFQGFLALLATDRKPEPIEVTVSREVKSLVRREGETGWLIQLSEGKSLFLSGIEEGSSDMYRFFGKTNSGGPFSVAVTDDPTGVEEAVLIVAGAALVICGTVYIYEAINKNCEDEAERTCGKGKVKRVHRKRFGITLSKAQVPTVNCNAGCHFECLAG